MRQLDWLTDPHLDFLRPEALDAFIERLAQGPGDGLLISGDIAESTTLINLLQRLDQEVSKPIWFVLGNHDYYRSSITRTRERVRQWSQQSRHTRWLPSEGVVSLSPCTALVGHGGWGDGGYGDFLASSVRLNDYRFIEELRFHDLGKVRLHQRLLELGRDAAQSLRPALEEALRSHRKVILLTHVPPFVESCWHEGEAKLNEWTPHFTCQAMGTMLLDVMAAHPARSLTVLCGHTHSSGTAQLRPNLTVHTGGAEYGRPALERLEHALVIAQEDERPRADLSLSAGRVDPCGGSVPDGVPAR